MFSLAAVKAPPPSSSTRAFSSEGTSEKSKLSKLFSAGKRAALMRAARRCSAREATSAARQAASDSSWRPARLLAVAHDLLEGAGQAGHLELLGVELHLGGDDLGVHRAHAQQLVVATEVGRRQGERERLGHRDRRRCRVGGVQGQLAHVARRSAASRDRGSRERRGEPLEAELAAEQEDLGEAVMSVGRAQRQVAGTHEHRVGARERGAGERRPRLAREGVEVVGQLEHDLAARVAARVARRPARSRGRARRDRRSSRRAAWSEAQVTGTE